METIKTQPFGSTVHITLDSKDSLETVENMIIRNQPGALVKPTKPTKYPMDAERSQHPVGREDATCRGTGSGQVARAGPHTRYWSERGYAHRRHESGH